MEESLKEEKEYTLSVLLGKGWYMSQFGLDLKENNYGSRMAAIENYIWNMRMEQKNLSRQMKVGITMVQTLKIQESILERF